MSIGNPPYDENLSPSLQDWLVEVQNELNKRRRPIYIPVNQFSGFSGTSGGSIQSDGSGNPVLQEINSLGIAGARIDATDDACHHLLHIPIDFNVDTNIRIAVVWCTDSSDVSESATWRIRYSSIAEGEALSAATTAMNDVITADSVGGNYVINISSYGLIIGGVIRHEDLLHLEVSLNAVSGLNPSVDQVYLLGILINDEG